MHIFPEKCVSLCPTFVHQKPGEQKISLLLPASLGERAKQSEIRKAAPEAARLEKGLLLQVLSVSGGLFALGRIRGFQTERKQAVEQRLDCIICNIGVALSAHFGKAAESGAALQNDIGSVRVGLTGVDNGFIREKSLCVASVIVRSGFRY